MKTNKIFLAILGLTLSTSAFASDNYKLVCDDNGIFEAPLVITIRGSEASAAGEFSGPGDAFFSVNYKNLDASNLRTTDNGSIEEVTVVQPSFLPRKPGFDLILKATAQGKLKGHISMVSTDEDKMPYDGAVTCTVKE